MPPLPCLGLPAQNGPTARGRRAPGPPPPRRRLRRADASAAPTQVGVIAKKRVPRAVTGGMINGVAMGGIFIIFGLQLWYGLWLASEGYLFRRRLYPQLAGLPHCGARPHTLPLRAYPRLVCSLELERLTSFLPGSLPSFYLLPFFLTCFLASFLPSFLACFLASLLPCFLASLLPCLLLKSRTGRSTRSTRSSCGCR